MPVVEELNSVYLLPVTRQAHFQYSSLTCEPTAPTGLWGKKGAGLGTRAWPCLLPPQAFPVASSGQSYLFVEQAKRHIEENSLQAVEQGKDVG